MPGHLRGKAWVFRGLLDVDWEICPYSLVRDLQRKGPITYEELGQYCMIKVDPEFPKKVRAGDFIVAEHNMGYGHDHDHACIAIKGAGVSAVLCESAAPYFLRNSIDHGLPVLEIPEVAQAVRQGDELEIDLAQGVVTNVNSGVRLTFMPFPQFIVEIIDAGGLYPMLRKQVRAAPGDPPGSRVVFSDETSCVDLVKRYLEACSARRLEEAEACLADDRELVFPWGRFRTLAEVFTKAQGRYRWARKHYDTWDTIRHADGSGIVIVAGTLYGEAVDGKPFADVRYIDRFVIRDGRIVLHQVWNDLAESGVLAGEESPSHVSREGR